MSNPAEILGGFCWNDYRQWPDDERWEVIDGRAYAMSPSPSVRHQMLQARLTAELDLFFRGRPCRVIAAPMDVRLSDSDIVQPDLLVVCDKQQIKDTHIEGAPALVIEILSKSSEQHDRGRKLALYARYGVAEVWLVKPYPALVEMFRLDRDDYRLHKVYMPDETLKSPAFAGLELPLAEVFDYPLEEGETLMMVREEQPRYA